MTAGVCLRVCVDKQGTHVCVCVETICISGHVLYCRALLRLWHVYVLCVHARDRPLLTAPVFSLDKSCVGCTHDRTSNQGGVGISKPTQGEEQVCPFGELRAPILASTSAAEGGHMGEGPGCYKGGHWGACALCGVLMC